MGNCGIFLIMGNAGFISSIRMPYQSQVEACCLLSIAPGTISNQSGVFGLGSQKQQFPDLHLGFRALEEFEPAFVSAPGSHSPFSVPLSPDRLGPLYSCKIDKVHVSHCPCHFSRKTFQPKD